MPHSAPPAAARPKWFWPLVAAAFVAVFFVYAPALSGPFVFDDLYLPFGRPEAEVWARQPLQGNRPLLMLSFWLNYLVSGQRPFSYHATNVALHFGVVVLVFALCRRLLGRAGEARERAWALAAFGAAVFLLHPLHTEAVAYVASRSDVLSTLLAYSALALFVFAFREPVAPPGIGRTLAILAFAAAAMAAKEQAAVIPGVILLADYFWNPGFSIRGIRANWRLHGLFALGGVAAVGVVIRVLAVSDTAGFGVGGVRWYQYFLTQCRVIWRYLRLTVLPIGQNLDPNFPLSASLADWTALAGLTALAAITVVAVLKRKQYPLAAFGWLLFLLMIAPTSSVVPINDVVAERRMYFPFLGLVLVMLEGVRRLRIEAHAAVACAAAVLISFGYWTSARAVLWGDPIALWSATAEASPGKARPAFQLAHALYGAGRYDEASESYAAAAAREKPNAELLLDWGLALDAARRPEDAVERLEQAAAIEPSAHVYATIGMVQAKMQRYGDALESLSKAKAKDPFHWPTYLYRGNTFAALGNWADAAVDYRRVLDLQPGNAAAAQGLSMAERNLR
ncbi:MAG: tetratricopeptide repeat protein [Bryobacteraceae bacterium]